MKVTKTSRITGIAHTVDIPLLTEEKWKEFLMSNVMIQTFFPYLTDDEREFLISGITPDEWAATFPEEDDEPMFEDGTNPLTDDEDGPSNPHEGEDDSEQEG